MIDRDISATAPVHVVMSNQQEYMPSIIVIIISATWPKAVVCGPCGELRPRGPPELSLRVCAALMAGKAHTSTESWVADENANEAHAKTPPAPPVEVSRQTSFGSLSEEHAMVQQASLNTTFMFVGIIVAFLLYNVYILFQVYDFFCYQPCLSEASEFELSIPMAKSSPVLTHSPN